MEGAKLKIVQAADVNFMRTMERAIRVGEPCLLQVCNVLCTILMLSSQCISDLMFLFNNYHVRCVI